MFLKSTLLTLLLLSLVNLGNAGAAAEIGLIKKLLTTIFDRFGHCNIILSSFESAQVQIRHGQLARGGRVNNWGPEKVRKNSTQVNEHWKVAE